MGKKNQNFLLTFILTLIILIVVVVIVDKIFGNPVTAIIIAVATGFILKKFEKLDINPSISFSFFSAYRNTAYEALISALILIGCYNLVVSILHYGKIFYGDEVICYIPFAISIIVLDWGSFMVGGLLIGKTYPKKALSLTFIAATALIFVEYPNLYLNSSFKNLECFFGEISENDYSSSFKIGGLIGLIVRGYIAILFAKIASKKILDGD